MSDADEIYRRLADAETERMLKRIDQIIAERTAKETTGDGDPSAQGAAGGVPIH
jgi:hypothetical protein